MKAPVLERTSAAKAGWLIIALTMAWLVFLFVPDPPPSPPVEPAVISAPVTSLTKAGLPERTDWVGLPEIFTIWADQAEWRNGRTRFVYWNPVAKDYSYEFEATRSRGGFTFQEVNAAEEALGVGEVLADDCPIRFLYQTRPTPDREGTKRILKPEIDRRAGKVEIDLPVTRLDTKAETRKPGPKH